MGIGTSRNGFGYPIQTGKAKYKCRYIVPNATPYQHPRGASHSIRFVCLQNEYASRIITKESPFYLLHGRDPRLPTDTALNTPRTCYQVDLDDYKTDLVTNLTEAWQLARQNIKQAQRKQKQQYDRHSKIPKFRVGERVFVYMPNAKQGKNWKFAKPFHGPFRILALTHTNASVRRVDKPQEHPIFVSLDRVRHSPEELPSGETWFGETWFGTTKKRRRNRRQRPPVVETGSSRQVHSPGVWSSCLRPRRGCLSSSQGEM